MAARRSPGWCGKTLLERGRRQSKFARIALRRLPKAVVAARFVREPDSPIAGRRSADFEHVEKIIELARIGGAVQDAWNCRD